MIAEKIQNLIKDALAGDPASVIALLCFGGMYLLITAFLMIQLVGRDGSVGKKVFWASVLCIPVLGWLFYLAFYQVPPSQHFR